MLILFGPVREPFSANSLEKRGFSPRLDAASLHFRCMFVVVWLQVRCRFLAASLPPDWANGIPYGRLIADLIEPAARLHEIMDMMSAQSFSQPKV